MTVHWARWTKSGLGQCRARSFALTKKEAPSRREFPPTYLSFAVQFRGIETGRTFTLTPTLLNDEDWDIPAIQGRCIGQPLRPQADIRAAHSRKTARLLRCHSNCSRAILLLSSESVCGKLLHDPVDEQPHKWRELSISRIKDRYRHRWKRVFGYPRPPSPKREHIDPVMCRSPA